MKNMKRILSVTIKRMVDDSPDTSFYGDYSTSPSSEFSIDRRHSLDCAINLGTVTEHDPDSHECEYLGNDAWSCGYLDNNDSGCTCDGEHLDRNSCEFFNPSFNYVGKDGKIQDNLTPDEVRKYTRQDYERMEQLQNGHWYFLGIAADAEIHINSNVVQKITSGGLWGVESDSGDYIAEVEGEQLAELRKELRALGFSTRAISKAFKDVERKDA